MLLRVSKLIRTVLGVMPMLHWCLLRSLKALVFPTTAWKCVLNCKRSNVLRTTSLAVVRIAGVSAAPFIGAVPTRGVCGVDAQRSNGVHATFGDAVERLENQSLVESVPSEHCHSAVFAHKGKGYRARYYRSFAWIPYMKVGTKRGCAKYHAVAVQRCFSRTVFANVAKRRFSPLLICSPCSCSLSAVTIALPLALKSSRTRGRSWEVLM